MTLHEFSGKHVLTREESERYQLPWEKQLQEPTISTQTQGTSGHRCLCLCCVITCCIKALGSAHNEQNVLSLERRAEDGTLKDPNPQPTSEQIQLWSSGFKFLMEDVAGRQLFALFLKEEFSEENLEFWLEVEAFRGMDTASEGQRGKGNWIYEVYVKPMSEREVNISGKTRREIADDLEQEELGKDLFDGAQSQVHSLMHRQSYPRFLTSSVFTSAVT